MQKLLLIIAFIFLAYSIKAQSFSGTVGAIPGSGATPTCFTAAVSGVGNINSSTNGLASVCLDINHPLVNELEIFLTAPDGTVVPLSVQNGGSGADYTGTCFTATASNPVKFASAPFTGSFLPEGYLGSVNNGQNADGVWALCILDSKNGANAGSLASWSLTFSNTPASPAPVSPACSFTLPVSSSCATATAICDLNGICGNISGSVVQDWIGSGLNGCFTLENNNFIKFEASATTASFTVWIPSSTTGIGGGIEMLFFSGTCGAGAVSTYGCYPHIYPLQSAGIPLPTVVTANGLTPGNTYYLMIDGYNGDNCTYTIQAKSGLNMVNINPSSSTICKGKNINLVATGGNGSYSWSPATGLSTTTNDTVNASPVTTTIYTVSSTNAVGCALSKDVTVNVNDTPLVTTHPDASIQHICKNDPIPALSVIANAGSGTISSYQWYITTTPSNATGAAWPSANLSSFTPSSASAGTLYFYCKITNSNGCSTKSDPSGAVIISNKPATPVASATIQPSCLVPTGTIVVTSPVGVNFEYSDDGLSYQASPTFTGLAPATYNITARNIVSGCVSPAKVITINAQPVVPGTPLGSVIQQPTCSTPTGSIDISFPLGTNIEYSVGGTYQAATTFTGLTPNTIYFITARDTSSGCASSILVLSTDPMPAAPSSPVASVTTQPDCFTNTGTITVTGPTGVNIEYNSNGGPSQASTIFNGLTPGGIYSIASRDILTGCVSAPTNLMVNAIPPIAAPVFTSPTTYCQYSSATPLIATGTNLLWYTAATGGIGSATAPTPSTTSAGSTTYYVSQTIGSCESPRTAVTIYIIAQPAAPAVITSVNYCENFPTSSLFATGASLLWYSSATGGTSNATAPTPSSVSTGNTDYYVSQTVSGCESPRAIITVTVNQIPAAPVVSTPVIYCQNINATALTSTGSNLLWYSTSTGGYGSAAAVPSTIIPGDSIYYVSQSVNGCESPRAAITVTVNPTPAVPVISIPVIYCQNTTSSALTATGSNLLWYNTATGGTGTATAPIPSTANAGNTNYYVTQTLLGCESPRALIKVTVYATPAAPTVNSPVTYCQYNTAAALTATGSNLLWYTVATGGTSNAVAPVPSTATPGNSFYYVSQTINGCEGPRSAITVTINADSTAVTAFSYNPDTVCINGINPGPAYASGFTNGGVFSSAAGLSINPANGSIKLTSSTPGSYLVKYNYNTTGCIHGDSTTSRITINPAVSTVTLFSYSSPVCKNDVNPLPSTMAGFTTGGSFVSSPGIVVKPLTGEVDLSTSTPGSYLITYSLPVLGCRLASNTFSFLNIVDTTRPVTKFSYTPAATCITSGTNPSLTKAAGFTSGGTFSATPAGLNINPATGAISIGLSTPGIYKVKYSVPKYLCRLANTDSSIVTINAYGNPVTDFSYFSPVCQGDTSATPVPETGFTNGGMFSSTAGLVIDANTGIANLIKSLPGTYTIKYTVPAGDCNPEGSSSATLNILKQPVPPDVMPYSMCGPGDATLSATSLGTIKWYTEPALINQVNVGNTMNTFLDSTTSYYLTSTVGTCSSEGALLNAQVYPLPKKPFLGNDTAVCSTDRFLLSPGVYDNYVWQDGSTQSSFAVTAAGNYMVTVSSGDGCSDSISINVTILDNCDDVYFPSAFSPDGNGLNDKFGPLGNLFIISNYSLRIFNRFGAVVFSSNNPSQKWDGMEKGKAGNGNYVYVASYTYKNRITKTQKGSILIVR